MYSNFDTYIIYVRNGVGSIHAIPRLEYLQLEFIAAKKGKSNILCATVIHPRVWVFEFKDHALDTQFQNNPILPRFKGNLFVIHEHVNTPLGL